MTQMNQSMKQNHGHREQTGGCQDMEDRLVGLGEGWSGRLGLADVNFSIWDG